MADDKNKHMDYDAEIAKFYDEFPEHRGLTYIVNPNAYDTLADFIADHPDFKEKLDDYQNYDRLRANDVPEQTIQDLKDRRYLTFEIESGERYFKKGGYCIDIYHLDTFLENVADHKPCPFISLVLPLSKEEPRTTRYLDMFDKAPFQDGRHLEISQKHTFHHEIGHALYNQTRSDEVMAFYDSGLKDNTFSFKTEAAAECYSMIRLCQEYGHDHEGVQFIYAERTLARLLDPDSPYSFLPAMHEVARLSQEGQLDNLSPQDCVDLAAKITDEKVLTPKRAMIIEMMAGNAYEYLTWAKNMKQFGARLGNMLSNTKEPDILREAQYFLQCVDDLTSNDPNVQDTVRTMWKKLHSNPEIRKNGPESQFFRSDKLNAKPRKMLMSTVRKKLFPKM